MLRVLALIFPEGGKCSTIHFMCYNYDSWLKIMIIIHLPFPFEDKLLEDKNHVNILPGPWSSQ